MNNLYLFLSRLCHSPTSRCAAVILIVLAWSSLAFCGEIHDAAKSGDLDKVKALLKTNSTLVFSKDDHGETPLFYAAAYGHKDVAELLLTSKADVNATDNNGMTPLHWAAATGQAAVAELLLANKADVNTQDTNGKTPSDYAAVSGQSKPARDGHLKTSHFEGRIALGAADAAQGRDERTQRELATLDIDLGGEWLVPPANCA